MVMGPNIGVAYTSNLNQIHSFEQYISVVSFLLVLFLLWYSYYVVMGRDNERKREIQ